MDRVRFGRALGYGARHAAKALITAVDAATAEDPNARRARPQSPPAAQNPTLTAASSRPAINITPADYAEAARRLAAMATSTAASRHTPSANPARPIAQIAARTLTQTREVQRGVARGSKRFGEAVWRPFVRLGGVLWLEVVGVFFGVFALIAFSYAWKLRYAWRPSADHAAHRSFMGALVMLALFGYFAVTSFLRARRRERGR